METHENCCRTVGDVLTHTLIQAMESKEAELDDEINRLDNMQEDDLEDRDAALRARLHDGRQHGHEGHGQHSQEDAQARILFDRLHGGGIPHRRRRIVKGFRHGAGPGRILSPSGT